MVETGGGLVRRLGTVGSLSSDRLDLDDGELVALVRGGLWLSANKTHLKDLLTGWCDDATRLLRAI